MAAFNGQIQDLSGNAVADFQVEVRDESTSNLAVLYSDKTLTTPLANPFTPNPLDNGHFRFYVAAGHYRIRAYTDEGDQVDWRDVQIGDDVAALAEEFLDEDENLGDVANAATAFDNIKQAASDSATGVVEKATAAEVRSAAADKYISADLIESASAFVTLIDAETVSFDWDSGINFSLAITANRTLGNPTNAQPGTWRTIRLQSASGGPFTLTFGNAYYGPAVDNPPDAVLDADEYILMIYCVHSSYFVVSSIYVID